MEYESSDGTGAGGGLPRSLVGLMSWRTSFVLGLITLILGVILAFRPTQSLAVIAVLLGVTMIVCGIYHIVRALDGREHERVWRGIAGVLFILTGLVLLRHLHLSVALIGLFIGFTWIIQGIVSLAEGFSGARQGGHGWSLFFGIVSLIAGIIVVVAPIGSLATLTVFLGIWFIVMGAMEMIGSLVVRRAARTLERAEGVSVPAQRADQPAAHQPAPGEGHATAASSRSENRNTTN
jgi:uncharacterized membrane protein HdeD (DUF308 family)